MIAETKIDVSDLIGIPFLRGGRGPDAFDCFGLVREVQRRRGIELPDAPSPQSMELQAAMVERIASHWTEPLDQVEPYCVVVFNSRRFGWHCGVVLENCRQFVHVAEFTKTSKIDLLDEWPWSHWIHGSYKCKNNCSGPSGP